VPNIPGFLTTIGVVSKDTFPAWIDLLYNYAWFVGFAISAISYSILMKGKIQRTSKDYKEMKVKGLEVEI
jgi:NCS1 family nucleobase:cation symporter-1